MKEDIRKQTALIIRKDGEYLVGRQIMNGRLIWSLSPWDAWTTRNREDAGTIAEITGGTIMLFNPIIGRIREAVM